jgi:hypothetical protein
VAVVVVAVVIAVAVAVAVVCVKAEHVTRPARTATGAVDAAATRAEPGARRHPPQEVPKARRAAHPNRVREI